MDKSRAELQLEIDMLRQEIKIAREASEITSEFVVKQFEQTESMLHKFQTAQSELQAVLDGATQLSIISTDLHGTIQLFSKGAATLLGYSAKEMIGRRNILTLHLGKDLNHYGYEVGGTSASTFQGMEVFDQFVKQKRSHGHEWFYVCKDGMHLPVSLSVTSLFSPVGNVVGYLFTAMDISLQKQLAIDLIQAKEAAEAASASRGDFLARMSHEIRTPMNGIIGMGSLLEKTALDPQQHNYCGKLLDSANTLLRLINDILDFSKIDAGKLELEDVPFNLEDILSNIANVVGMQAEAKGIEFLFKLNPDVPLDLIGDPLRLGQVLMNLSSNSVKFTEQGEIVISVAQKERFRSEVLLRFSVKDSGIGLRSDQMSSLFSAFSQADDSITRKYGGTGLGLAICKQLTELMGGKIWIETEPGKGAEFIFTAKFRLSEEFHENAGAPSSNHLQGLRALVVDDNKMARDVLSSMLTSLGLQIDTAIDGKTALNYMDKAVENKKPYDVVLLDWIMPGIDGIETARQIKANSALSKIPAMLMVTANAREEAYVEAEKVGMDGFLLKPVYASIMYSTLLDILGKEGAIGPLPIKKKELSVDLGKIKGARILLVDDNSINQEVATEFLQDVGAIVTVASNGRECLRELAQDVFNLVLMDIQMPEMDGLEATRKIRHDYSFKSLPIVAMTAHAMAGDKDKSLEAGMNDHITKPIDPSVLYQTLEQWLDVRGSGKPNIPNTDLTFEPKYRSLDLPFPILPGIDQDQALKALNYNTDLFVKMLHDFRKSYSSLPNELQDMSVHGMWDKIQEMAHTIKGVSGYVGSIKLRNSAEKLENALKNNQLEQAGRYLIVFRDSLDQILSSLSILPQIQNAREDVVELSSKQNIRILDIEPQLETLIEQLQRGELAAEETFASIQQSLEGSGFDKQLAAIADFIDDIEYESAADMVNKLLDESAVKREN